MENLIAAVPHHYLGAMTDLQIQELIDFSDQHLGEKITPFDRHWGKGIFFRDLQFTSYVRAAIYLRHILEETTRFQNGLVG